VTATASTSAVPNSWGAARDEVRAAILERGWSERRRAYAQSFDSDELDAAQLLMPILGFLPATDERMRSTIEAIAGELTEGGLVLRYRSEEGLNADGLSGEEGTSVICSFCLVSCLARPASRAGGGALRPAGGLCE
jgi:GH15 family glucan-1,4-alpha-glucosidase